LCFLSSSNDLSAAKKAKYNNINSNKYKKEDSDDLSETIKKQKLHLNDAVISKKHKERENINDLIFIYLKKHQITHHH